MPFVFEVRDLWPQTLIDMGALRETGWPQGCWPGWSCSCTAGPGGDQPAARVRQTISSGAGSPGENRPTSRMGSPRATRPSHPSRAPARTSVADGGMASRGRSGRICWVPWTREWPRTHWSEPPGNADQRRARSPSCSWGKDRKGGVPAVRGENSLDNVLFWVPCPSRRCLRSRALDVALFCLRDIPVFRYGLSSNKLFDYLASGRPVVAACAVIGNPVSASGAGICVPPESPKAVADALARMAAMGGAGRRVLGSRVARVGSGASPGRRSGRPVPAGARPGAAVNFYIAGAGGFGRETLDALRAASPACAAEQRIHRRARGGRRR